MMQKKCPYCKSSYVTVTKENTHYSHRKIEYKCECCSKTFSEEENYNRQLPDGKRIMTIHRFGYEKEEYELYSADKGKLFYVYKYHGASRYYKESLTKKPHLTFSDNSIVFWGEHEGPCTHFTCNFYGDVALRLSETEIVKVLKSRGYISGTSKHLRMVFPLTYATSKDLRKLYNEISHEIPTKVGGCYIASCVYGSYDCPQVWTLRRFRDETLNSTWYGRSFIRVYYAISPVIIRWFGMTKWFKNLWKPILDKMIYKLNLNGVENTPYIDKD